MRVALCRRNGSASAALAGEQPTSHDGGPLPSGSGEIADRRVENHQPDNGNPTDCADPLANPHRPACARRSDTPSPADSKRESPSAFPPPLPTGPADRG